MKATFLSPSFINSLAKKMPIVLRLFSYFTPYKTALIIAIIALMMFSLFDAGMVFWIKPLVDEGLAKSDGQVLRNGALLVLLIFFVRGLASFVSSYCMSWISTHITCTIRQQVFQHLLSMPVSFYQQHSIGSLLAKLTYDTEQIAKASSQVFITLIQESVIALVYLSIMFYYSWQLSLIFLLIGPVIGWILSKLSRRFRKINKNIQQSMGAITDAAEQTLRGHKEVLAFVSHEFEAKRFEQVNIKNRRHSMKLASAGAIGTPILQFVAAIAMSLVLFLASFEQILTQLTPGAFVSILVAMGSLLRPLRRLTKINEGLQRGLAACSSIFTLLDTPTEQAIADANVNTSVDINKTIKKSTNKPELTGNITFKQLNFSYPNTENPTLTNISLSIKSGEKIALIGRSGSGKSTLTNLLMHFYQAKQQSLFFDEYAIESIDINYLRSQIAWVSQHTILFSGSIAENIAYGCHKHFSRAAIENAAQAAQVMEFANKMNNGLDSEIGHDGKMLSGGQRQRIAIARALLKDAPIVIFDEATSALDSGSEQAINHAVTHIMQEKTVLIITHKLSAIKNVDKIILLDNGEIIEQGDHQTLVAQQGEYCHQVG